MTSRALWPTSAIQEVVSSVTDLGAQLDNVSADLGAEITRLVSKDGELQASIDALSAASVAGISGIFSAVEDGVTATPDGGQFILASSTTGRVDLYRREGSTATYVMEWIPRSGVAGPYTDYNAFIAEAIPSETKAACFLAAGILVTVRRATSGSIVSADGSRWEPADGVYSPLHYGAKADGSDDGVALNAAFSAFRAAVNASPTNVSPLTMDFFCRTYTTTIPINGTGLTKAGWALKNGAIIGKCTGKCVLDLIGSRQGRYSNIIVYGDKTAMPSVGIQTARAAAGGTLAFCDLCDWSSVHTRGYFQTVGLWAYGQESSKYSRCSFWNYNPTGAAAFHVGTDDFEYNGARPMLMQSDYLAPITGETSCINNGYDTIDYGYLPIGRFYSGSVLTRGTQTVFTAGDPPTNLSVGQRVVFRAEDYQTSAYGTIGTVTAISGNDITVSIDSSGWAVPAGQVWSLVVAQTGPTMIFGRARGHCFSSCYCVAYGDYSLHVIFGDQSALDNIQLDFLFEGGGPGYIKLVAERPGLALRCGSISLYQVRCQNSCINSTSAYPVQLYDMKISVPAARHTTPLIFDDPARYGIVGGSIYAYQADRLPRTGWSTFRTEVADGSGAATSYGISRAGNTDVKQISGGPASLNTRYLDATGVMQGFSRFSVDTHAFIFSCDGSTTNYNLTAAAFYPAGAGLTDLGLASLPWRTVYAGKYAAGGSVGVSGTYTTADGKTVTVTGGIITEIV